MVCWGFIKTCLCMFAKYIGVLIYIIGCLLFETPSDPQTPDAKVNRDGFKNYFKIDPGNEVKNIYFSAVEWPPLDAVYRFAFSAPQAVIDNIIEDRQLKKIENDTHSHYNSHYTWEELPDDKNNQLYQLRNERIFVELKYNPKTQKCVFVEFVF